MDIKDFVAQMPKVELHLHIEGSLEPELVFAIARRNSVDLPYADVDSLRQAYQFSDLQSFLDVYYLAAQVVIEEQDFYEMTYAYLARAAQDQVRYCEIFFDPQTHTDRGVPFHTVLDGISRACEVGSSALNINSQLIMCFLRHLSEDEAFKTLEAALPFRDRIAGVGLDSGEQGNPPSKFVRVFEAARKAGFRLVAHAGEEGPAANVRDALDLLHVERVDHGVRAVEDPALMRRLAAQRTPLTVCPLSNIRLCVYPQMAAHPILEMLAQGICVTVNSDDPAYFGGYMNANFLALVEGLNASQAELAQLASNGIDATWLDAAAKKRLHDELAGFVASAGA